MRTYTVTKRVVIEYTFRNVEATSAEGAREIAEDTGDVYADEISNVSETYSTKWERD